MKISVNLLIVTMLLSLPCVIHAGLIEEELEETEFEGVKTIKGQRQVQPINVTLEQMATRDAIRHIKQDINAPMWFAAGCILPGFSLFAPYYNKPIVPTARLVGRPPQYVAHYTDAYIREMKKRQFTHVLAGCIVGGVAYTGCLGVSIYYYTVGF